MPENVFGVPLRDISSEHHECGTLQHGPALNAEYCLGLYGKARIRDRCGGLSYVSDIIASAHQLAAAGTTNETQAKADDVARCLQSISTVFVASLHAGTAAAFL